MGFRDHGYYGYAFVGARPLQIISLIVVVGMVSNFTNEDSRALISIPGQVVGTLIFSCLGLLWTLLSVTAYDDTHFPYLATSAMDILFMIPFIVIAAIFGGPLSATTCSDYSTTDTDGLFTLAVGHNTASAILFVGNTQSTCKQIMAVWGFIIVLCILFALSGFATGLLYLGERRVAAAAQGPVGGAGPNDESQIELAIATAPASSEAKAFGQ